MSTLADGPDQVRFWRRHTWSGMALCVLLPLLVVLRELLGGEPGRAPLVLALAVLLAAPLVLLVPVERVVRHPHGRWFFYGWEAAGIVAVTLVMWFDGGATSLYVAFYYVILAHAALAYPPRGVVLAGGAVLLVYGVMIAVGPQPSAGDVVLRLGTLALVTSTCAMASEAHRRLYRRTARYAHELATLADLDGLTGTLNHRAFHRRLRTALQHASPAEPVSVLLLDVDDFKAVNDTHGHPEGDVVLQRVAAALLGLCRSTDAAARLGGDEFALLLPGADRDAAAAVAARVQPALDALGGLVPVHVSTGVATADRPVQPGVVLAEADRRAYEVKRGRKAERETRPVGRPGDAGGGAAAG